METVSRISIATLLLLAFMAASSRAQPNQQTYIIHFDRSKIKTAYQSLGNSRPWYEAMLDSIAEVSSKEEDESEATPPQLLYAYETVMFGFAARLSSKQLESLSKFGGFQYAFPDEKLSLHTTYSPQFLGLEKGKGLWHASNLKSDVIIGVVDTGIWSEHPSFQDHGLSPVPKRWKVACIEGTKFSSSNCNRKLIGAKFFYKGYEASNGKINETRDFKSARDSDGHGTHTASTAAGSPVGNANLFGLANGSAAGLRYTSRIAIYKTCWPVCTATDVLAAIQQAILDGVDVLSISLGSPSQPYYKDYMAIATFQAIVNGVFVSCSAGNEGPSESTLRNTAAPWITTVGASSLDRSFPAIVTLGNGQTFEGSSLYVGKGTEQLPLVHGKTAGGQGAEYCIAGSLSRQLVQGKMVLCQQGKNGRADKGEQVKMAGGAAMLLINTKHEGGELLANADVLPASSLGASGGKAIKMYMNSTKSPTASIVFKGATYGNRAPIVGAFSSRGPNSVGLDVIKPDVTAPGVNILAAWPAITSPNGLKSDKRRTLFNIITGTSMSCPHVSGIAALLKSRHKDWSPAAIKSALMTTAYVTDNKGSPILDIAFNSDATPFAFGSGHVDPERASDPGLIYDITPEDYVYYLCSLKYNDSQISLFAGDFTCPKLATMQPGDLNYPSFAVNFKISAQNISFTYKRSVTNVGAPKSTYKVLVEEPKGVSVIVKPKILTFKKLGQKLSDKVSFIGLKRTKPVAASSFGSLVWVSGKYRVRSPIAASWH